MIITINDTEVHATDKQIEAINVLSEARAGGCASVKGYRPTTNWIESPTQNIQFLSRVSTERLYRRRLKALMDLEYSDIAEYVKDDVKLSSMDKDDLLELYCARWSTEVSSLQKTLSGNRNDAHRQGHDRCYIGITKGVKVNLVTEKGDDDKKHPVLTDGIPTIASILISAFYLNVKTTVEGERKIVDSGCPVRMGNLIKRKLNQTGLNLKMLSLKEDNFDSLKIDGQAILPEGLEDIAA